MIDPESAIAAIFAALGIWMIILLIGLLFWAWMFHDALKTRDTLWIILFIFCFLTGVGQSIIAIVYYFLVYRVKHIKRI